MPDPAIIPEHLKYIGMHPYHIFVMQEENLDFIMILILENKNYTLKKIKYFFIFKQQIIQKALQEFYK